MGKEYVPHRFDSYNEQQLIAALFKAQKENNIDDYNEAKYRLDGFYDHFGPKLAAKIAANIEANEAVENAKAYTDNEMSPLARENFNNTRLGVVGIFNLFVLYLYFTGRTGGGFPFVLMIGGSVGVFMGITMAENLFSGLTQAGYALFLNKKEKGNPMFQNWRKSHHVYWDQQYGEKFDPTDTSSVSTEEIDKWYYTHGPGANLSPMRDPRNEDDSQLN